MTTKQVRWKCLNCDSGVLAPSRPRKDDVRRYCLKCSAKTGKLVERVAPSLEKKREASKAKSTQKQKVKRAKIAQAKTSHSGFDVEKEAQRLWKILQTQENKPTRPIPSIKIVNRKRSASSGVCYYGEHAVTLNLGTETIDAWETLAHELNHAIGHRGHDHNFYRSLKQLTETRWKIRVNSFDWSRAGYNCDWDLRKQLKSKEVVKF
jgi:hypothetical protein